MLGGRPQANECGTCAVVALVLKDRIFVVRRWGGCVGVLRSQPAGLEGGYSNPRNEPLWRSGTSRRKGVV